MAQMEGFAEHLYNKHDCTAAVINRFFDADWLKEWHERAHDITFVAHDHTAPYTTEIEEA
jgi:hypothetical protein